MTITLDGPWAKLVREDGKVTAALPLVDHCLDVGAAMEVVVSAWRPWLEAAAGRALSAQDLARLCALAALHDIGKANWGFQAKIDPDDKLKAGHTGPVAALLNHQGFDRDGLRYRPVSRALNAMILEWGAGEHFAAVMAHHGRPLTEFGSKPALGAAPWSKHVRYWMPERGSDPTIAALSVLDAVRARWPLAWEAGAALPDWPRLVALFAGLVTLADWLGSDTRRLPVERPHGAAREPLRAEQVLAAAKARGFLPLDTPACGFEDAFGNPPYPFQTAAAAGDLGAVALIEAETGSGKTEAALWRWMALRRRGLVDGLFFALPTRSAAVQLHERVNDMLKRVWKEHAPEAVLAVPGYLRAGDAKGQALPGYQVRWDRGEPGGADDARWAAERSLNFLAARVAVGTIDQALLGTLPVKHALFRTGVLARSLLVVDEVHASDSYMAGLLKRLLEHHVAIGGHALLLSATLGSTARATLLKTALPSLAEAEAQPYPALSGREATLRPAKGPARDDKRVLVETAGLMSDPQAIAERAIAAAQAGASVLVVRNSVGGAVAVAQAIAAMAPEVAFSVGGVATLHHGRFAPDDRERLDKAVETAFGKTRIARGQVLVGTQTLEQSLDLDADFLVTDLAPIDVLLQRIGRLHRHKRADRGAFAQARVLVLRPPERDLSPLLGHVGGERHGLGSVYANLVQLEATLRLLEASPEIVIPRDNRRLVEQALHPEALDAIARAGGDAWRNHAHERAGGDHAAGRTAEAVALDLSRPFRELVFADVDEAVVTRLGARDLLVDLSPPLAGPFGGEIARVAIPAHMLGTLKPHDEPEVIDTRSFRLGTRRFGYNQWGLHRLG